MGVPSIISVVFIAAGAYLSVSASINEQLCVPAWLLLMLAGFAMLETGTMNELIKKKLGTGSD